MSTPTLDEPMWNHVSRPTCMQHQERIPHINMIMDAYSLIQILDNQHPMKKLRMGSLILSWVTKQITIHTSHIKTNTKKHLINDINVYLKIQIVDNQHLRIRANNKSSNSRLSSQINEKICIHQFKYLISISKNRSVEIKK